MYCYFSGMIFEQFNEQFMKNQELRYSLNQFVLEMEKKRIEQNNKLIYR